MSDSEWLPYLRTHRNPVAFKVLRKSNVDAHKHRDWFLNLACAMDETAPAEGKMLTKFYLFLRDHIPHGLVGERFGHIRGNEVMDHLLSHPGESTPSRHNVTKHVTTALADLEQWMAKRKDWRDALAKGRQDAGKRAGKKTSAETSLILRSSAELLAALVLSHPSPDGKLRGIIGRLQVDWMVTQRRDALRVENGFWKGITSEDLSEVFSTAPVNVVVGEPLIDYDRLFGPAFARCRKDIRPHLPREWVGRLTPLTDNPSDIEEGHAHEVFDVSSDDNDGEAQPAVPSLRVTESPATIDEVQRLRGHLDAPGMATEALEKWLIDKHQAEQESGTELVPKIFCAWCKHWEARIDEVATCQDQSLVRSLFMQSLCRLNSLCSADSAWANAFMLVDIVGNTSAPAVGDQQEVLSKLLRFPATQSCTDMNHRLVKAVKDGTDSSIVHQQADQTTAEQSQVLCTMMTSPFLHEWSNVMALETLYARLIIQGMQNPTLEREEMEFLQTERDLILSKPVVETLKLSTWQRRALLLPGSFHVLTNYQNRLLRHKFFPQLRVPAPHPHGDGPLPVLHTTVYPDAILNEHPHLHKLFGETKPVPRPETPSTPTPTQVSFPDANTPAPWTAIRAPLVLAGRDLLSRSSSAQETPPGKKPSRYAGMSHFSAKRKAEDDTNGPASKAPRLEGILSAASLERIMSEELGELREAVYQNSRAAMEQVKGDLLGQLKQQAAQQSELQDSMRKDTQLALEVDRTKLQSLVSNLGRQKIEAADRIEAYFQGSTLHSGIHTVVQPLLQTSFQKQSSDVHTQLEDVRQQQSIALQEIRQQQADTLREIKEQQADTLREIRHQQSVLQEIKQQQTDGIHDIRQLHEQSLREMTSIRAHQAESLRELGQELGTIKEQVRLGLEKQATFPDIVGQAIENVKTKTAAPQPGEDGFLARCIAPPPWDQQSYEVALVRAAMLYFQTLGLPEDGVSPDEEAFTVVVEAFPRLIEDHIEMAVDHMHMITYRQRFIDRVYSE